jgi:hypothetical protein
VHRSTVQRHLNVLEAAGWLERRRPSPPEQRRGKRTVYRLIIPRSVGPDAQGPRERVTPPSSRNPTAGEGSHSDGVVGADLARCVSHHQVGAECDTGGCTTRPDQNEPEKSSKPLPTDDEVMIDRLRERLASDPEIGIKATPAHVRRLVADVLAGATGTVIRPEQYVLASVRRDPARFRPAEVPPPWRELREQLWGGHVA